MAEHIPAGANLRLRSPAANEAAGDPLSPAMPVEGWGLAWYMWATVALHGVQGRPHYLRTKGEGSGGPGRPGG